MTRNPQQTIVLGQVEACGPAAAFTLCAMRNELFGGIAVNVEPFDFEGRRICATWRQCDGDVAVMDSGAGRMLSPGESREIAARAGILEAIEEHAAELKL